MDWQGLEAGLSFCAPSLGQTACLGVCLPWLVLGDERVLQKDLLGDSSSFLGFAAFLAVF